MNNGQKIILPPSNDLIVPEHVAKQKADPMLAAADMIKAVRRAKDAGLATIAAVLTKYHTQGLNMAIDASIPEAYVVLTINTNMFIEGNELKVSSGQMLRLGTHYEAALTHLRDQIDAEKKKDAPAPDESAAPAPEAAGGATDDTKN